MTVPQKRAGLAGIVQDHHTRIRRLEGSPGGGGSSSCLNCDVLIPGGVPVPDDLRACVDAPGGFNSGAGEFNANNGLFQGPYGTTQYVGKGGNVDLEPSVRLQARAQAYTDVGLYGGAGSLRINLNFDGVPGSTIDFDFPDLASSPGGNFDSGWVDWFDAINTGDCSLLTADISIAQNAALGGPNCGWAWFLRWVITTDGGTEYRGALDDLPQGEAYADVIHFDSRTHEFVVGPRSVPSRAISFFMGG